MAAIEQAMGGREATHRQPPSRTTSQEGQMIDFTTVDVEPSAQEGAPAATDPTVSLSQNGEDAEVGPVNTTPMGTVTAEGQPPRPRLDVVGYLRVVRRRADLSQRDLARALGAPPSRIGDLEAERRAPRVGELERILAQAQLHLAVVDDHGEPVQPEPRDLALDASGRRLPAHLDPAQPEERPWFTQIRYDRHPARVPVSQRYRRDAARARAGGPIDYPTEQDVRDAPELAYRRRQQEQADALAAAMPDILRSEARVEACACPDECFVTVCIPTCPCRCEAPAC